jgi:hypothetical protein
MLSLSVPRVEIYKYQESLLFVLGVTSKLSPSRRTDKEVVQPYPTAIMFYSPNFILTSLAALCTTLASGQKYPVGDAIFNPPELKHFIHVDILSAFPINTTTIYGGATQVPNMGGKDPIPEQLPGKRTLTKQYRQCHWRH